MENDANATSEVEKQIDRKIGEVRTDTLDMSFGELMTLHSNHELVISPEYQRLFRWSPDQQSRLIESILLELPIPQIFVVENEDGRFELIDGLQRISSVIHFVQPEQLDFGHLRLQGCDIIPQLNGMIFGDLPLRLRLRLKRASVRINIIKRQSSPMIRYEMFKRLNTGGSELSPQEIRNCTARMVGQPGIHFYSFLQECAAYPAFDECISTLSEGEGEKKADEELVLRFFAVKEAENAFSGSVRDWLDAFMDDVVLGKRLFSYDLQRTEFKSVFDVLQNSLGDGAFVKYRQNRPIGGLAPAYFEGVTGGVFHALEHISSLSPDEIRDRVIRTVQSPEFKECTGPGANSKPKLRRRIALIKSSLLATSD